MNHQDRFTQTRDIDGPIAAALLALDYANNCNSKNRCWDWANQAIALVPSLAQHTGKLSWPDTAAMREHLETLQPGAVPPQETPAQAPTLLDQACILAARAQISIDAGSFDRAAACAALAQALVAIHEAQNAPF